MSRFLYLVVAQPVMESAAMAMIRYLIFILYVICATFLNADDTDLLRKVADKKRIVFSFFALSMFNFDKACRADIIKKSAKISVFT
jgi:hypothetical protein